MVQCLSANHILEITGILNGTTNYMLSKMFQDEISFEAALGEAKVHGYAEADPSDDINGKDSCRKICILASLAFGSHIYPRQVDTVGISSVTSEEVLFAHTNGYQIKLLGRALYREDGRHCVYVAPHLVSEKHMLSAVQDVFNSIIVVGDAIGEVMFYGRGAGALPTASAVVADIIDSVKHLGSRKWIGWQPSRDTAPFTCTNMETAWYVRTDDGDGRIIGPLTQAALTEWEETQPMKPKFRMRVL
jgi:homoserine dehydrogenase